MEQSVESKSLYEELEQIFYRQRKLMQAVKALRRQQSDREVTSVLLGAEKSMENALLALKRARP